MASKLGTPLARQRSGHVYLFAAAGVAAVSAFGAFHSAYGWRVSEWAAGITVSLYVFPWRTARHRENVQVDDTGVWCCVTKPMLCNSMDILELRQQYNTEVGCEDHRDEQ
jgi:hypothetical protein